MDIRIEYLPMQSIVYMRRIGAYGIENFALMKRMKQWVQQKELWNERTVIYGIAHDDETTPPEQCRYDVCLAVPSAFQVDSSVQKGELPAGEYAIFTIEHTSEAVQNFWNTFYGEVSKLEKQFGTARPLLELYANVKINAGYCEFCVPTVSA